MQDRILKNSWRCSPSLSNICSWWLLFNEHSLHNSAKLNASFIAIFCSFCYLGFSYRSPVSNNTKHKRSIEVMLGKTLRRSVCRTRGVWTITRTRTTRYNCHHRLCSSRNDGCIIITTVRFFLIVKLIVQNRKSWTPPCSIYEISLPSRLPATFTRRFDNR